MGMATNTDDTGRIRDDFRAIHDAFISLKGAYNGTAITGGDKERHSMEIIEADGLPGYTPIIDTLSMGMSDDHLIAVENGSNMVRVGSAIFS